MTRFIDRSPAGGLAVALAASILPAGLPDHVAPEAERRPRRPPRTSPGRGIEPAGPKTDFHRDVGPEQEFNVHVELARFQEAQGDNESAVLEYQKAVDVCEKKGSALAHAKLGPAQHSLAQRRMAAALDRMGRFTQAETHYLKALKLAPKDPKVWNDAGYSYYLQNRLADAERSFKTADSLGPNNALVLTNLGLVLAAEGKNDESLAVFTRAGGPAVGHANLGYILAAMGKTNLAREHYQSALGLQPGVDPRPRGPRQARFRHPRSSDHGRRLDRPSPQRPSSRARIGDPSGTAKPRCKLKAKDKDPQVARAPRSRSSPDTSGR